MSIVVNANANRFPSDAMFRPTELLNMIFFAVLLTS